MNDDQACQPTDEIRERKSFSKLSDLTRVFFRFDKQCAAEN